MAFQSTATVTTTATSLFNTSTTPWDMFALNVAIDVDQSPSGVVYVGSADVTTSGATKGRKLAAGDALDLGVCRPGEAWYAITASGTVYLSVLAVPGI